MPRERKKTFRVLSSFLDFPKERTLTLRESLFAQVRTRRQQFAFLCVTPPAGRGDAKNFNSGPVVARRKWRPTCRAIIRIRSPYNPFYPVDFIASQRAAVKNGENARPSFAVNYKYQFNDRGTPPHRARRPLGFAYMPRISRYLRFGLYDSHVKRFQLRTPAARERGRETETRGIRWGSRELGGLNRERRILTSL